MPLIDNLLDQFTVNATPNKACFYLFPVVMTSKRPVKLGYSLSHFVQFHEQLASRLEDHQTTGYVTICLSLRQSL